MRERDSVWLFSLCAIALVGSAALSAGQDAPVRSGPVDAAPRALAAQVQALQEHLAQMQAQMDRMQAEAGELQSELRDVRAQLAAATSDPHEENAVSSQAAPHRASQSGGQRNSLRDRLSQLEDKQQILESKVDDQYQSKVESASKYRVVLSGIALLNVFSNRGNVDNQDVPTLARAPGPLNSNATFGATVRQSEVGVDVFGPELAGARTHGEVQADFFGGFPSALNGVNSGVMRLRTATFDMDWGHTSLVAGQDNLFFSPLSPASFASLAEPALSYSGNLWAWTPQLRVEHRFDLTDHSSFILQGGVLDPLTGEPPFTSNFYRLAQAGERSGQPAYATRAAWSGQAFGRTMTVGFGGYYSRENWGFGRNVDGWAGTADWNVPLGRWFTFSGEFYRGRAIGGLGGGVGRSVLYNGPLTDPATAVLGLNSVGGWSELKFRPIERLEFNAAFGEDDSFAADLRRFPSAQSYFDAAVHKNQSGLLNLIYRPRSNLLLSLEYSRWWTSELSEAAYRANQINLGIGVLF